MCAWFFGPCFVFLFKFDQPCHSWKPRNRISSVSDYKDEGTIKSAAAELTNGAESLDVLVNCGGK